VSPIGLRVPRAEGAGEGGISNPFRFKDLRHIVHVEFDFAAFPPGPFNGKPYGPRANPKPPSSLSKRPRFRRRLAQEFAESFGSGD